MNNIVKKVFILLAIIFFIALIINHFIFNKPIIEGIDSDEDYNEYKNNPNVLIYKNAANISVHQNTIKDLQTKVTNLEQLEPEVKGNSKSIKTLLTSQAKQHALSAVGKSLSSSKSSKSNQSAMDFFKGDDNKKMKSGMKLKPKKKTKSPTASEIFGSKSKGKSKSSFGGFFGDSDKKKDKDKSKSSFGGFGGSSGGSGGSGDSGFGGF